MASALALAGLFTPEASCVACSRDFLPSRQCERACGSSNSGGSKLWSSMRATSALNRGTPMKVRQLEASLCVTKFVRFQGKEASCLRRGEKCVPIEQGSAKQWNKLGGRPEFSATSGLWPRMVFGGSARALCRPSLVDAAVRAISSDRLRARDDSSGRVRAEASREAFVGWRRFVPIETSTVGLTGGLSEAHALTAGAATRRSLKTLASSAAEGIVAEPSSVRKLSKKKEIVPDQRLSSLREAFGKEGDDAIDAYIIPSEDPHQSEFIADCFQRRAFISGFTGSSGTAVVTREHAALWTDGRYFLQAEKQLGPGWTLMRQGTAGVPPVGDWLREVLLKGSRVGIDPFLFSADAAEDLKQTLRAGDLKLLLLYEENLVDRVWGEKKPSPPTAHMRVHDLRYAGVDVRSKISSIRDSMKAAGATAHIISMLDEVAWVLNLRGGDVPHSPVTYAYLVIEQEVATLFVDGVKITPEVASHLKGASVTVQPYTSLVPSIQRLAETGAKLWMDPKRLSVAIVEAFNNACSAYYEKANVSVGNKDRFHERLNGPAAIARSSPVSLAKALKNPSELEGMRQAHLRDAAALAEFWAWLENEVVDQGKSLTEVEVADRLEEFRAKQAGFLDTSFDTIAGSGANGAIVHYRAEPSSCGEVDNQKLFLLDSGAQFVDGTTDITRTVHFGTPTARQQECFTRVLQGHIAVDKAVFPEHTPGFVLDVLARSSLWKIGLDYRHGTGHGVGAALNVHEGPQSISSRFGNMTGLQAGMIISNEPGYYEDRSFGIRIENLLIVREVDTPNNYGGTTYLGFERLTYVPIQTKMLDLTIMSEEEIDWLNAYHTEVWEKVSPLLDGEAHSWLQRNTELISNKTIGEDKVVVAGTT